MGKQNPRFVTISEKFESKIDSLVGFIYPIKGHAVRGIQLTNVFVLNSKLFVMFIFVIIRLLIYH